MINTIKGLTVVQWIGERKGTYQAIVKVPAGFVTAYQIGSKLPSLNGWKKGALQTLLFLAEGSEYPLVVFAKKGNKVILIDEEIAKGVEVGTINQLFHNTNLMDHKQYQAVNAKTWADKAFLLNE
jgi:hypothetical protein